MKLKKLWQVLWMAAGLLPFFFCRLAAKYSKTQYVLPDITEKEATYYPPESEASKAFMDIVLDIAPDEMQQSACIDDIL